MKSLFEMGIHGLMTNQFAMAVTSQNIANANVPFYSRQEVNFTESFYSLFGNGVSITDVRRIFDDSVNRNLQRSNSAWAESDAYLQNIREFETLFDNDSYSISNDINEALNVLNVLNANPSSLPSRELYLNQLQNIASRFHALDEGIQSKQQNINKTLKADVASINEITKRVAMLNGKISLASVNERSALLDQRDQALDNLAKLIDFDTLVGDEGICNIQLSNGCPLVSGNNSYSLTALPDPDDSSKIEIGLVSNQSRITVTPLLKGGELGGLLSFQNNALEEAKISLGRLALVFSQTFNDQQKLGIDLNGNVGGNIFNDINQPAACAGRVINSSRNQGTGNLSVSINDAGKLCASDYTLVFDSASHYQLIRKSDLQIVGNGDITGYPVSIAADGFSIDIADGNFVAGDIFAVSPTKNAARNFTMDLSDGAAFALGLPDNNPASGDNRNGLAMAQLFQQGILDNNTLDFSQAYRLISSTISLKTNVAQISADTNAIIKEQAASIRDQISGVSLQEETLNLAKYQQTFEASAQILDAGQKIFDIVLGLARR